MARLQQPLFGTSVWPSDASCPKIQGKNTKTKLYPPLAGCARNSGTACGYKALPMSPGRGSIPPQHGCWDYSMSGKLKGRMLKAAWAAPLPHSPKERQNFPFANPCLSFSGFPTAAHSRCMTPCSRPRWGASLPTSTAAHRVCKGRFVPLQGLLL